MSSGTASVAASWIIFAALAGLAFAVTTLDTHTLAGLAASGVSAALGLVAKRRS